LRHEPDRYDYYGHRRHERERCDAKEQVDHRLSAGTTEDAIFPSNRLASPRASLAARADVCMAATAFPAPAQ
jgi:hypothetical protein